MWMLVIMGLGFIGLSIWVNWRRIRCKTEITGIFVRFNACSSKGVKAYSPVFRYAFLGEQFEQQSMDDVPRRKHSECVPGKQYQLYLNERNPKEVVHQKRPQGNDLLFAIIGLIFLLAGLM